MKQLILFILIIGALLLVSCSNGQPADGADNTTAETEAVTETDETTTSYNRLSELEAKNFDGQTFAVLDANDHPDMHVNASIGEMNGEIINDALYARDLYMSETYGVNMEYTTITYGNTACQGAANSVLAGDHVYDMIIGPIPGGSLGDTALKGVFYNLMDLPYMSLSENWWSPLVYESMRVNNKLFYTASDISPVIYQSPTALYLNKKLYNDYGIETDYYGAVYNGTWTLDVFMSMIKDMDQDLNGDGQMSSDTDFFGFIYDMNKLSVGSMAVGAGVSIMDVDDSGSVTVSVNNEQTLNIIDRLREMMPSYVEVGELHDFMLDSFCQSKALILLHYVETALNRLRSMDDDYSILPAPKYDELQETYRSMLNPWADAFIAVPLLVDTEYTGYVLEVLAFYSYENIRPSIYGITLKDKVSRDEDSAAMLDVIYNTTYLDISEIYSFGGVADMLYRSVVQEAPFTSEYAKIEAKLNQEIATFTKQWN